ncbi:hypothetical protein MMC29_002394 [Sticta canariensis]|nr:hypothetical protein [Sticta canariensis]
MRFKTNHISAVVTAISCVVRGWYSFPQISLNSSLSAGFNKAKRTDVAPGMELRIMPLGASITYGSHSSDGNGYRCPLAENLSGTKLRFIGSVQSGNMADNYNEGHPGATIRDTANFERASLGYRPNVILLHVGTNDFDSVSPKETTEDAPERLDGLIDDLVFACPDAAILVAQLVHAEDPLYEKRIQLFNNQVPGIVAKRANAGHRVMVADMRSITKQYLIDGIHPTDVGYKMMADIWFACIKAARAKGWIQRPIGPDPPAIKTNKIDLKTAQTVLKLKQRCRKQPFLSAVNKGQFLTGGLGRNGGAKFSPKWVNQGKVSIGRGLQAAEIHFADLNGDGRADYLWVNPKTGAIIAYLNTGNSLAQGWTPVNHGKHIAAGAGSTGDGVFFADLNGDNKADYIYVHKDGKFSWWRNDGASARENIGWKWHGPIVLHVGASHVSRKNVVFGDINGDGRDDFLFKDAKGGLEA